VFIFLKKGKNKEENKDAMYCVLHKDLVVQVDLCKHAKARGTNDELQIFDGMDGIIIVHKRLLAHGCLSVNGNALDFTDGVITFNCNAITVGRADRE
jgi:hypothetical protein